MTIGSLAKEVTLFSDATGMLNSPVNDLTALANKV